MLALGIYTSIPKAVTDITGIDQNITLYYDSSISPEYAIEPTWFKDETIHFVSSDEDIFTVSETGKITAVRIGEAVLHMSALNYEEKVNVSIVPKVTEITGVEESYSLTTGGSVDIDPVRKPKKFADQPVKFKSADKSIADVSSDGVITAVKAGTTTVKVSSGGTSVKTKVTVTDPAPVYYYRSSSSSSKKSSSGSSGGSKKKSSSKSSSGYFDSGDDEYFGD
jgi:alpha-amylase